MKRIVPTVVSYNPYAAGNGMSAAGSGNYAVTQYSLGQNRVVFRDNAGGMGVGANTTIHATANARI
jgi:hypothetical protein